MEVEVNVANSLKLLISALPYDKRVKRNIEFHVQVDHYLETHAYQLTCLVILCKLDYFQCVFSEPADFLNESFFYEVYNTLAGIERRTSVSSDIAKLRADISRVINLYVEKIGFLIIPRY